MLKIFNKLVDKYKYNGKIYVLTDDANNDFIKEILHYENIRTAKITDNFNHFSVILLKYKINIIQILEKVINSNMNNNKIILVVNKDFDFNNLYKKVRVNTIDSIIPPNSEEYFIILDNFMKL